MTTTDAPAPGTSHKNTVGYRITPRVIVEHITLLKVITNSGTPQEKILYSTAQTEAECNQTAANFEDLPNVTTNVSQAWRFRILAANGQFVSSSALFSGKGVASSWARFIAIGIGVEAEIPE